jgi:putative ABC transport system ATP-binding protein
MQAAAELDGVEIAFGRGEARTQALRGVNLRVDAGELLMVVGPSGCGKTTLVSVLAGLLRPDSGRVRILGADLARLGSGEQADFRATHLGFVFQSFNLIPALSILDNVAIPARLAGVADPVGAARRMLERVGLGDRLAARPMQLSGGQQQRVAIARAVVHSPRLVVADEPSSALDHENGHAAMVLLRTLVADGQRALVVVTHDPRVEHFADRIATMEDGHIVRYVRRRIDDAVLEQLPTPSTPASDAEALAELAQSTP